MALSSMTNSLVAPVRSSAYLPAGRAVEATTRAPHVVAGVRHDPLSWPMTPSALLACLINPYTLAVQPRPLLFTILAFAFASARHWSLWPGASNRHYILPLLASMAGRPNPGSRVPIVAESVLIREANILASEAEPCRVTQVVVIRDPILVTLVAPQQFMLLFLGSREVRMTVPFSVAWPAKWAQSVLVLVLATVAMVVPVLNVPTRVLNPRVIPMQFPLQRQPLANRVAPVAFVLAIKLAQTLRQRSPLAALLLVHVPSKVPKGIICLAPPVVPSTGRMSATIILAAGDNRRTPVIVVPQPINTAVNLAARNIILLIFTRKHIRVGAVLLRKTDLTTPSTPASDTLVHF